MMKKVPILFHAIWLSLLIILLSSACGSENISPANADLTATSDRATQNYLCCTAVPQLETFTPTPSQNGSEVILYRGNPQRTGAYNTEAIRHQPEVKWQTQVSSTWLMPPMVADGILYTGSGDGVLYALNAETGELIWSTGGFGQLESTGAIAGDMIITGGELVQALDRQIGNVLWSFRTGYFVQGSPLIVADRVYVATDHVVFALDLQSGQLIWRVATGNEGAFMGAPAYDEGVIYTTGGKLLLALDAETGKELWRVEKNEMFLGLAVTNGFVYVGNWDHHLYAFDQSTSEEKWNFEVGGVFWSAPAVNEDIVYAGNTDFVYALSTQTGELLWSYQTDGDSVSEPMIAGDVVYVSDSSHEFPRGPRHLYALDANTGEELWVFESVSTFLPAPALGDGVIYVTSTGKVIALK
jgi:eukaryotic-like serine/threonine-protein kinase